MVCLWVCQRARAGLFDVARRVLGCSLMGRPGDDRLSRVLRRSTIGAEGFHGRVRNGIGCWAPRYDHQVVSSENAVRVRRRIARFCAVQDSLRVRWTGRADARRMIQPAGAAMRLPGRSFEEDGDQANRAIRTGRLNALPRFHPRPINVVVYHGSHARPRFEGGFPLRCIQRLSRPHIATRRCRWRDNRYTRGASIPVLSY